MNMSLNNVKVEIILNVFNAQDIIDTFFQSLSKQTFKDFSIIVVDDGSTDQTIKKVEEYKSNFNMRIVKRDHEGLQKARKYGVENAKGDIIIILDADLILDKNAIKELLAPFKNIKVGGVGGVLKNTKRNLVESSYGSLRNLFYSLKTKENGTDWISGGFSAVRTSIVKKVGGYVDTQSSEDIDISWKIKNGGYKLVLNNKAIAYHRDPTSFKEVWKREKNTGYREFFLTKSHLKESLKPRRILRFYPFFLPIIIPLLFIFSYQLLLFIFLLSYVLLFLFLKGSIKIKIVAWFVFNVMNIAYCIGFFIAIVKR